jgi:ketosteroid isomerase-like protein
MNRKALAAIGLAVLVAAVDRGVEAADSSAKIVVEKRIAAVMRHDLEAIVALYATDAVEISPGFCSNRIGAEGARRTYGDLFQSYPTITDENATYVVQGNHVAVQFVARVRKPDGSLLFEVSIANFLDVAHGRITRDVTYFDTKGRPCT